MPGDGALRLLGSYFMVFPAIVVGVALLVTRFGGGTAFAYGAMAFMVFALLAASAGVGAARNPAKWPVYRARLRWYALVLALTWVGVNRFNESYSAGSVGRQYGDQVPATAMELKEWGRYFHLVIVPNLIMSLSFVGLGMLRAARGADSAIKAESVTSRDMVPAQDDLHHDANDGLHGGEGTREEGAPA
jgi:hypothetical protein